MVAYKHLVPDPVFECDRLLYVRVSGRRAVVLRHFDGTPVRGFHGSWEPVFLYTGLGCMYFLALEQHGTQASWILAPDGRRLGDKLADLAPEQRARLQEAAASHGLGGLDGLIGDGIQLIEPRLLREVLALAGSLGAPDANSASAESGTPTRLGLGMLGAPHGLVTHLPGAAGDPLLQLGEGWASVDGAVGRATGALSVAATPVMPAASRFLLTMTLMPAVPEPAEIEILVDDCSVGMLMLDPHWQAEGADVAFWLPPERVGGRPFKLGFRHTQDFVLAALRLQHGRALAEPVTEPREMMLRFENIGDNCEFGLVQRHYGAEPVGLLRFAGLRNPRRLIRFLEDDFGSFGEPGSLGVSIIGGEYWIIDHVYGLAYHTFRYQHEVAADVVIRENETKAAYLRRKFREDLEDGEKILVYKRVVTQDLHEMLALQSALNRFGTANRLFWVTEADGRHVPGEVEWVGNRLLKGYLGRISLNDANDFNAETWLNLCRNALAAFQALESS